jgi:uncharacterized repeat protein (TIGR03803 family)
MPSLWVCCRRPFIVQAQSFSTITTFQLSGPNCLIQGAGGNFYGCGEESIFELTPSGDVTTLVNKEPAYSLFQASDGNSYGTTLQSIFKVTPNGSVSVLYTFTLMGRPNPGANPNSIIQGSDGNFYGTAREGGTSANPSSYGIGSIFKITPNAALTVLYNFSGPDGASPQTGLIQGADGNFSGTAAGGGAYTPSSCKNFRGCGTVFKITTTVPTKPGDVIILWGTGFGPTSPSVPAGVETPSSTTYNTATAVSVTVGTTAATGYAGLYQVAIQIPASLANGDYPVLAAMSGSQSPSTTMITVQQ